MTCVYCTARPATEVIKVPGLRLRFAACGPCAADAIGSIPQARISPLEAVGQRPDVLVGGGTVLVTPL